MLVGCSALQILLSKVIFVSVTENDRKFVAQCYLWRIRVLCICVWCPRRLCDIEFLETYTLRSLVHIFYVAILPLHWQCRPGPQRVHASKNNAIHSQQHILTQLLKCNLSVTITKSSA
jgi:hypothetical protein